MLRTGGRLIVSVDHPLIIHAMHRLAGCKVNYFAAYNWTEEWIMGGQAVPMSFWHRPLHAMTDAFTAAGFRLAAISEPQPVPEARELFPRRISLPRHQPELPVLRSRCRLTAPRNDQPC